MLNKILYLFIAPLMGLTFVILFLQGRSSFLHYQYPNRFNDVAISMEPLFDIELFAPAYCFYLVLAILFQYLIALKVWDIYLQKKQLFGFKLYQLVTIACILFGLCFGLLFWQAHTGIQRLFFSTIETTTIAGIYWASNITTLLIISKAQKFKNY